jgi:glutathione S-transferase
MAPTSALWWRADSKEGKAAPEVATTAWGLFAKQLTGKQFVVGDRFTLGDIAAAVATDYLTRLGLEPPGIIRAWVARCFEVPGMKASLDEAMPYIGSGLEMRKADGGRDSHADPSAAGRDR